MPKGQGHITIRRRPKDGADGKNAVRLDLTNQNASILYDGEGTNISGTITSEAKLYEGASEVEGVEFSISERSGCDESQATIDSSTGVVTVTNISTSGYLIVQVTYKEVTYAAKLVLTKIVGNVKYDLVVTPNAIAYNSTTGEKSADEIAVQVYRTAVTSNGNSERVAVGSIADGYMLIDGTAKITSWNSSGHKIAVDTSKTEHTIAIYAGEVEQDVETIPINKTKNGADGKTAYSPKIGDNGNWFFYNDETGQYEDSGRSATGDDGHSPYVGDNGNWFEWDATLTPPDYVDTGVKAQGENGSNAIRLDLTNQNDSILYDAEGVKLSENITSKAVVYDGTTEASGVTFSITERVGCDEASSTIDASTGEISITDITTSGHIVVTASYNGVALSSQLNFTRIVGDTKYSVLATPSAISYNTTTGVKSSESIVVKVYKTTANAEGGVTTSLVETLPSNVKLYADGTDKSSSYSSSYTHAVDFTKSDHVFSVKVDSVEQDSETVPINKVKDGDKGDPGDKGDDGVTYWLQPSATSISVDKDGNPSPSLIYCLPYKQVGTGEPMSASDVTMYYGYDTESPTTRYSGGRFMVDATKSYICFTMKRSGTIRCTATIPIMKDGADGADGTDGVDGKDGTDGKDGNPGKDGKGIASQTEYYAVGTASAVGSNWNEGTPPSFTSEYKYLWKYTVTTYTDGTSDETTPGIVGAVGSEGLTVRQSTWKVDTEYHNDNNPFYRDENGVGYLDVVTKTDMIIYSSANPPDAWECQKTHIAANSIDTSTNPPKYPLPSTTSDNAAWTKFVSSRPIITSLILANKIVAGMIDVEDLTADNTFITNLIAKHLQTATLNPSSKVIAINKDDLGYIQVYEGLVERVRISGQAVDDVSDLITETTYASSTTKRSITIAKDSTPPAAYRDITVYTSSQFSFGGAAFSIKDTTLNVTLPLLNTTEQSLPDWGAVEARVELYNTSSSSVLATFSATSKDVTRTTAGYTASMKIVAGNGYAPYPPPVSTVKHYLKLILRIRPNFSITAAKTGYINSYTLKGAFIANAKMMYIGNNGFCTMWGVNNYVSVTADNDVQIRNGSVGMNVQKNNLQLIMDNLTYNLSIDTAQDTDGSTINVLKLTQTT